jgi:hypothetical protein
MDAEKTSASRCVSPNGNDFVFICVYLRASAVQDLFPAADWAINRRPNYLGKIHGVQSLSPLFQTRRTI